MSLPASQRAPGKGLEPHNDVSQLQVPLLLQMGQHSSPEEDLALTNSVQVVIQFQGFDLLGGKYFSKQVLYLDKLVIKIWLHDFLMMSLFCNKIIADIASTM